MRFSLDQAFPVLVSRGTMLAFLLLYRSTIFDSKKSTDSADFAVFADVFYRQRIFDPKTALSKSAKNAKTAPLG